MSWVLVQANRWGYAYLVSLRENHAARCSVRGVVKVIRYDREERELSGHILLPLSVM